jgi:DNA polymerase-3 subunit delta
VGTAPIVLLWGDDPFLLRDEALRVLGEVEAREVDAPEWEGAELSDLATPSLFGEPRALLVNDCRKLTNEAKTALTGYLAAPDPDAILVLSCTTADRGKPPAALVKAVTPVGEVREVKVSRKELPGWIVQRGRRRGVDVTGPAAAALVERLGEEAAALDQAVEQLGGAYPGRTITPDLVASQFRGLGEQHLWDLCDRSFAKDLPGAITALRSMLEQRAEPLMILGGVAARVRDLLKVRALPERTPPAEIAKAAGLRFDWQGRRYREQAFRFTMPELIAIHGRLVDADRALKSGAEGDIVLAALIGEIAGERAVVAV